MDILKSLLKAASYVMYGSCFFLGSCQKGTLGQQIVTNEVRSPYSMSFIYDYGAIIEGIYQLDMLSGEKYWVVADNRTKVMLINFKKRVDTFSVPFSDTFSDFAVSGNKVYAFTDSFIHQATIYSPDSVVLAKVKSPQSLFSSIYIASNIHSPIQITGEFSFLVPYRPNQTANPNMLDTFAYIYLRRDSKGEWLWKKMVPYPVRFSKTYELLTGPLLAMSNNKLFYTFESGKKIFRQNFNGTSIDSLRMYSSGHIPFDVSKINEMTYIYNYTLNQNVNSKMLVDGQGYVYVIRSNDKNNQLKSTITCYDQDLKPIDRKGITQRLNPEITYTDNGKIYVYVDRSDSLFVCISLRNGKGSMHDEYRPISPAKEDSIDYTKAAARFINRFQLTGTDSFYLVSCISCDGCVEEFLDSISTRTTTVFVVDTTCYVSELNPIRNGKRRHVPREEMDKFFGHFGNMVLVTNKNDKTSFTPVLK